jgi:hypothetical protein
MSSGSELAYVVLASSAMLVVIEIKEWVSVSAVEHPLSLVVPTIEDASSTAVFADMQKTGFNTKMSDAQGSGCLKELSVAGQHQGELGFQGDGKNYFVFVW